MTEPARNDLELLNELHRLIVARSEGTLDSAGFARLEQLVVGNPQAGEIFARYLLQAAGLRAWAASMGDSGSDNTPQHGTRTPVVPRFFKRVVPTAYWLVLHNRPVSWVTAAVVMIIVVGAMTLIYSPKPRDQALRRGVRELPSGDVPEAQFAARIARLQKAEWGVPAEGGEAAGAVHYRSPETLQAESALAPGDQLYLKRGVAEIEFAKGTRIVLEGPARLTIDGNNFCALDLGKLVARVETEEAKGFIVRTPTASITDLGTEFGVEVERSGQAQAHVFRGLIEIAHVAGPAGGVSSQPPQRVGAGQTAIIGNAQGAIRVVSQEKGKIPFTRILPPEQVQRLRLTPVADSRIRSAASDSRDGQEDMLSVYTVPPNVQRTVLKFAMPERRGDSRIGRATLLLTRHPSSHLATADNAQQRPMDVYRLTSPWSEAAVTWMVASPARPWTTPGGYGVGRDGNLFAAPFASSTARPGQGETIAWDVTELVAGWYEGRYENHGLIVGSQAPNQPHFASREFAAAEARPRLEIDLLHEGKDNPPQTNP